MIFVDKLFGTIPAQFIWFVALTGLMQWVYRYHKFGNHIHFVGDNKDSAQMMGINVDRVKIIAFVQLGFFSALAGIFTMYEMLYFWPTQGSGLMLTTLAAVFVGGTSVFGGRGTVYGTFIGVLIIGSLESGIVALGLSGFYVQFINGLMITIAVTIYALIQKEKHKMKKALWLDSINKEKILNYKRLKGGVSSEVYKVTTNTKTYCVKRSLKKLMVKKNG